LEHHNRHRLAATHIQRSGSVEHKAQAKAQKPIGFTNRTSREERETKPA